MNKVSLIVPIYNTEKYLNKCLDSILNSTYQNIEIIIVNDGTQDKSMDIVKSYKDKRIKIYEKENGGLSSARNYGLDKATGKYVIFIDSDDYIDKFMIQVLVSQIEKTSSDMIECNFFYDYETKNKVKPDYRYFYRDKKEFLAKGRVLVCNKIFRKSVIDKYNLRFQEGIHYEDIGFTHKFVLNSKKVDYVESAFYYYVQRSDSIIGNNNYKGKLDIIMALDDLIKYYKENKFYNKYKMELEYLCTRIILGSSLKRILKIKNREKRLEYIDKTYEFLITNFPKYKKNTYLRENSKKNLALKLMNKRLLKIVGHII